MHVGCGLCPVPQAYNHIALNSRGARRLLVWQFALGDPVRPVGEKAQALVGSKACNRQRHASHRLPGLDALLPEF